MSESRAQMTGLVQVFWFWLPLAASWLLMTCEGPIVQALISRSADSAIHLAAFGITLSLQIAIESPVIMLLATSTRLATHRQAYRALRGFVLSLNLILTVVAAIISFTPVYDGLVPWLMGIPAPIAAAARPAMRIMTFWTAAIGWRRFLQGVLIRSGDTRSVGWGTAVRLFFSAGTAGGLFAFTETPGVEIGACALMAGVTFECLLIHLLARRAVAALPERPHAERLTGAQILHFHTPLAATSFLSLAIQPVVSSGLARMDDPEQTLAAWPVLFWLLMVFQAAGFALPETVIALRRSAADQVLLWRFARGLLGALVAVMALFFLTPASDFYLERLARVPAAVIPYVNAGAVLGAMIPALQLLQYWFRGVLMAMHSTREIIVAMAGELVLVVGIVQLGVQLGWPGMPAVCAALVVAMGAEVSFLALRARSRLRGALV